MQKGAACCCLPSMCNQGGYLFIKVLSKRNVLLWFYTTCIMRKTIYKNRHFGTFQKDKFVHLFNIVLKSHPMARCRRDEKHKAFPFIRQRQIKVHYRKFNHAFNWTACGMGLVIDAPLARKIELAYLFIYFSFFFLPPILLLFRKSR